MPHRARYGALTAFAVSAALLHCGNESFNGAGDDSQGQDAASDSTSQDGTISDGAVTDGTSSDGAFLFDDPCNGSSHTLCCDFDTDGGAATCFSAQQTDKGMLTIATDVFQSPPHSLHSTANGDAGNAYGRANLVGTTEATCTFDLYIKQLNGVGHNIFSVYMNGDDMKSIVSVIDPDTDGGANLRVFGPQSGGSLFAPGKLSLPLRAWMRLRVDATLPGTGDVLGSVSTISFDGGAPVAIQTTIPSVTSFGVAVGFDFVGSGNGDAYIDNLVCDTH